MTLEPPRLLEMQALLRVSNLSKAYGSIRALEDVNLHVYPGEVLGIVGESGSGKSTVLRLLNLEEPEDTGTYQLEIPELSGQNLFELDKFQRREIRVRHIGIVYQNPHLGLRMRSSSSGNVAERLILAGEKRFAIGKLTRARASITTRRKRCKHRFAMFDV